MQGALLYMAVFFWYIVKRDLSSVHFCRTVRYCTVAYDITNVTFYKVIVMFIWSGYTFGDVLKQIRILGIKVDLS